MQAAVAALRRSGAGIRGAVHWHGWDNGDSFDLFESTNENGRAKVLDILAAASGASAARHTPTHAA